MEEKTIEKALTRASFKVMDKMQNAPSISNLNSLKSRPGSTDSDEPLEDVDTMKKVR